MILPNELRIGNYVLALSPATLKDIPWEIRINNFELAQFYKPIPLTPELLEKCGFEWQTANHCRKGDFHIVRQQIGVIGGIERDDYFIYFKEGPAIRKIESLHQLQNLFFAITGEEIDVKL